ncbi:MAG TPA: lipase maturation factor family protein, partial [Acidobacteriota bacterium]|nr:lipase maturation factor family protein [Acidobacteriota bacterium]
MTLSKPLMIFDGDCGFCRRWIARWREVTGECIEYAPYQQVAGEFPDIPIEAFTRAVQLVEPGGIRSQGAEAVFRTLAYVRSGAWMLWCYEHVPLVALVSEGIYALIAAHRGAAARLTQLLWGDHLERPTYRAASWLFLRALALTYLIAFLSIWVQIDGLIGHAGILPLESYLNAVRNFTGSERYWLLPTLSWLSSGDGFLHFLCGGGVLLSFLALLGIAPAPCFLLLWAFYLSLASDGREFLGFQWDALLLDAGFLAIFFSPPRWRSRPASDRHSTFFLFLLRWLLFRLMFSSGIVKLISGDPTWRDLTALQYHFETQPLPTWIGWYAFQLPIAVKTGMTAVMFFIEIVVPFLAFAPRRLRLVSFSLLVFLQGTIALTGNYAFFNFLTVALCLLLLDDAVWPRKWWVQPAREAPRQSAKGWPAWVTRPAGILVLVFTTMSLSATLRVTFPWPRVAEALHEKVAPFRSFNSYGLFAVMTTTRPEIIVEGSNDGQTWMPYEFRWKPGDLKRRPTFVAPHQPRLDWQMWFAALETYESNPWFVDFLARLLQGSPDVLALLAHNPFPDYPPRFIRASVYQYRFTDLSELKGTGAWWKREYAGVYFPVRTLAQCKRQLPLLLTSRLTASLESSDLRAGARINSHFGASSVAPAA